LSIFDPATQEIQEQHDVDINYGNYFTSDPANSPTTSITRGRKRAILYSQTPERFTQWVWSKVNPAHFICHSQGGNTVRYLISLMIQGSGQHPEYFSEEKRGNWAISVTTLGTPHKGTTIIDVIENFMAQETK
jgi:triacylglycerol esterase/lipase EstA (alpha/beta hydrolase family)